jgi:hypothetical protein
MLTTANEVRESTEVLVVDAGPGRQKTELAKDLERCDREMAAAMEALLTGSAPVDDALLWYTDWCRERELILLASDEDADWCRFDPAQ